MLDPWQTEIEARLHKLEASVFQDDARNSSGARGRAKSEDDVKAYCKSIGLTESDGTFFWCRWESAGSGGWYNAGKKIRDWRMVIRQWQAGQWCPSQKRAQFQKPQSAQPQMTMWEIERRLEAINGELNKTELSKDNPDVAARRHKLFEERTRLKQMKTGIPI